jgi:hypothetical protein
MNWGWGTWQLGILPYNRAAGRLWRVPELPGQDQPSPQRPAAPLRPAQHPGHHEAVRRVSLFKRRDPSAGLHPHVAKQLRRQLRQHLRQESPLQGVSFGGAPFSLFGTSVRLTEVTDGMSNTLLAAEVVQGQGFDTRGRCGASWHGRETNATTERGYRQRQPGARRNSAPRPRRAPTAKRWPSGLTSTALALSTGRVIVSLAAHGEVQDDPQDRCRDGPTAPQNESVHARPPFRAVRTSATHDTGIATMWGCGFLGKRVTWANWPRK